MRKMYLWKALLLALALLLCLGALAEAPDGFSFSGGTGKVTISCPEVYEKDGQTRAKLIFSSPNYPSLTLDGAEYTATHGDGTSEFDIPVTVNEDLTISAVTTAMSRPHAIKYTVRISLGEDAPEPEAAEAPPEADAAVDRAPVEGLTFERSMPLRYAQCFSVDYCAGGYVFIDIRDGDRVLLVPEGGEAPAGLPEDVIVLQKPLSNIYLAATSAMALFDRLDALDTIGMSSLQAEDWSVENARAAMEAGSIAFAGKYSEPDYELLLSSGCRLAIESTMIFHTPKVKEMLESLGIPVLIDRSSYEPHPLGRTEWIKLYAAIVGKEAAAEAFFDERADLIEAYSEFPNTEKTVAFFYISSDKSVVVRNSTDYVPRMIEIAGGRYALSDIVDPDSSRSSVTTTLEQFYDAAVDADYLIYNANIASPLSSLEELCALSPLFEGFKAVREGNVWCTGKDLYQETDDVGELIVDIHNMLTGQGDMRFLTHIE